MVSDSGKDEEGAFGAVGQALVDAGVVKENGRPAYDQNDPDRMVEIVTKYFEASK